MFISYFFKTKTTKGQKLFTFKYNITVGTRGVPLDESNYRNYEDPTIPRWLFMTGWIKLLWLRAAKVYQHSDLSWSFSHHWFIFSEIQFNRCKKKKNHKVKMMNQKRTKEALKDKRSTKHLQCCLICFFHVFYHNEGKWQQIMRKFITFISS